jgi:uncharacterized protein
MKEEGVSSFGRYKFQELCKRDQRHHLALLCGARFDDQSWWLLSNEQIVKAANSLTPSRARAACWRTAS